MPRIRKAAGLAVAVASVALLLAGCHVPPHRPIPTSTTVAPTTTTATSTMPTTAPVSTTVPTTTTVAPTTTTVPITVTTPASPTNDFPTAADTGAVGPLTDVTPSTGELILGDDNQVLENTRVHGTVTVLGCNVTIRNVAVDTDVLETAPGDNVFGLWLKEDPSCGVTVDHVSVLTPLGQYVTEGARIARGGPATVTASKFIGQQLGMTVGSGTTMTDSYIEVAPAFGGDHNEDILEDGIDGFTLDHNTFLNPNSQTSALSLFNEFGPNSNFLVEDNLMAGGGYTCYCGDGTKTDDGRSARASNISVINNVFWRKYFSTVGEVAPARAYNPAGGGRWAGNVYMDADGTLTNEAVPQPPLDGQ